MIYADWVVRIQQHARMRRARAADVLQGFPRRLHPANVAHRNRHLRIWLHTATRDYLYALRRRARETP